MHRAARAAMLGHTHLLVVRFEVDPEPDHVGVHPDGLPYDDEPPSPILARAMRVEGDQLIISLETTAADGTPVTRTLTWDRLGATA